MRFVILVILILLMAAFPVDLFADTLVSGSVNGVWNRQGSPYIATGDLVLQNGEQMTIQAGVQVFFEGAYSFSIYGRLQAIGSEEDSISFVPQEENNDWGGLRFLDADSLSRLTYCVVTNGINMDGNGHADPVSCGGNIFIWGGNVRIERSRISHGRTRGFGGGIAVWESDPFIQHCLINENASQEHAGGIGVSRTSSPTITDCEFIDNDANWDGGGVCVEGNSDPHIERCIFRNNGAAVGGGLTSNSASPVVTYCEFVDNNASTGGGIFISEGEDIIIEWCKFLSNSADVNAGAILIRFGARAQVLYSRFIENQANNGGAISVWNEPACQIHHNLFVRNSAVSGGVFASNDRHQMGGTPLSMTNCTFIDNRSRMPDNNPSIAFLHNNSRLNLSSCLIWGSTQPYFQNQNRVTVTYSHIQNNFAGQGNSTENPGIFELDSTWCLLKGNSSCIDTGNPNLPNDPDNSRNDRGWMYFPNNAYDGLDPNEFYVQLNAGEREPRMVRFRNNSQAPLYVSTMDLWQEGAREVMMNVSNLTGDTEIMCGLWLEQGFYIAGGNSGHDPNKMYHIDRDFNLRGHFDQPGGVDGLGFLDLASDGEETIYASDEEQIVEFITNGEFGGSYEGPDGIRNFNAIGADFNYPYGGYDFYVAGNEGYIIRTDEDYWEEDRIQVGDTIRGLGVKGNARALYIMTESSPGYCILSLVTPDDRKVVPLYSITPPNPNSRIGGIEITQGWHDVRGSLVGIWRGDGDNSDWLFVTDLYTTWLSVFPDWKLLMPGEEAEWEVVFAGDQVETGLYQSQFYLSVNGYGEDGAIAVMLRANPAYINDGRSNHSPYSFRIISISPNPFNSSTEVRYSISHPGLTTLNVFNQLGKKVNILHQGFLKPGFHTSYWNSDGCPTGVYYICMNQGGFVSVSRKVVLTK